MGCAALSSFLITLPLKAFSGYRFSRAPGSTVVPSHGSPANLAGISKLRSVAVVGLQMWESRLRFPSLALCARRHVQAIRLPSLVLLLAGDKLLLYTEPPRPCAPSCWLRPLWLPAGACVM